MQLCAPASELGLKLSLQLGRSPKWIELTVELPQRSLCALPKEGVGVVWAGL
ncbi:MAG: hypothetical protein MK297_10810 [Planctomycetes bacterium]|nr:hypothetical protein [Planctomycetota bacterium]